jgi:dUTP pyrophosphatase
VPELKIYLSEEARSAGVEVRTPRPLDAGFDLPALEQVTIAPGAKCAVRTGVHTAIPEGWVGIVKDRSSVALRGGVTVAGVIDSAYRGEIKVIMYNLSDKHLTLEKGERLAQCLVIPHLEATQSVFVDSFDDLGETERGRGGFGSTGK